jgi:hypothetical protein
MLAPPSGNEGNKLLVAAFAFAWVSVPVPGHDQAVLQRSEPASSISVKEAANPDGQSYTASLSHSIKLFSTLQVWMEVEMWARRRGARCSITTRWMSRA